MVDFRQAIPPEGAHPIEDAAAIRLCLDYLRDEAKRLGLPFASHLIGVAAEAVGDAIALSRKADAFSETTVHNTMVN